MEYLPQAIGIFAMCISVLSYQRKTQKGIVSMQFCSSTLFTLHYYLLGELSGALLNIGSIFRAVVFILRNNYKWAKHWIWYVIFSVIFITIYVLMFTVFHKEPTVENLIVEFLPVLGSIAFTISFGMENAKLVRMFALFGSPPWLAYNICVLSVGGILTEAFALVSIITGIIRLDIKKSVRRENNAK